MKKLSLPKEILCALATDLMMGIEWSFDIRKMALVMYGQKYRMYRAVKRRMYEQAIRTALQRLERQQCIRKKKVGEKFILSLTNKGQQRIIREQIRSTPPLPKGTYTLVLFDIPEKRRLARDLFRRLLKECSFTRWQQSVWMSNQDCFAHLQQYIRYHNIEQWVTVCTTKNLSGKNE